MAVATRTSLRDLLLAGKPVDLGTLRPVLERDFPELAALAHASITAAAGLARENALEHTQQVLWQVQPRLHELPPEEAQALYLAALLHELSPAPAALARDVLFRLQLPGPLRDQVVYLVRTHKSPLTFGARQAGTGHMLRLAWTLNTRILFLLAEAHAQASRLPRTHRRWQALAAFRARCEELDVFGREPPPLIAPARWHKLVPTDPRLQRRVAGELRFWRIMGALADRSQAEAWLRAQAPVEPAGSLYLPVGVPGSGKSTWIAENLPQARLISMDEMRERLTGNRADQSRNPEVYRRCRSELARALRAGETVVWDAQNHTWSSRQGLLALARETHAYVVTVYFDIPLALALQRNTGRQAVVPEAVIVRSYGDLHEPRPFEAEELWRVDAYGHTSRHVNDETTGA